MLILSGQVKRETCMSLTGLTNLRQLGDQEVDIIRMVGGITKYAVLVTIPKASAIIWSGPGFSRRPDAPAPAGSIFRWTCNPRRSTRTIFAATIPRKTRCPGTTAVIREQCAEVIRRLAAA